MKTTATAIVFTAIISAMSASAFAQSQWDKDHPRRAEVNGRLNNQNAKTANEVKNGKLTPAQGQQLHHEDHQIRKEERSMASQNGGHITGQEQKTLNQQENRVNQQRRADIKGNQ
jgi:hypothetical protein